MSWLCFKISVEIDYIHYKNTYINKPLNFYSKKNMTLKNNNKDKNNKKILPKKGTIPFYFNKSSQQIKNHNTCNKNIELKKTQNGTIPYLFDQIKKNKINKNTKTQTNATDFFRFSTQ